MILLNKLKNEDIEKYPYYVIHLLGMSYQLVGDFYTYQYDSKERVLYQEGPFFTIFQDNGNDFLYTSFELDSHYELKNCEYDNFVACETQNYPMLKEENSSLVQQMSITKRTNLSDSSFFDGLATYCQHNENTGTDFIISYPIIYDEKVHLYPSYFMNPWMMIYTKNNRIQECYRILTADRDTLAYHLLTIQEYGWKDFLKFGSFALQKKEFIQRYLKGIGNIFSGTNIPFYPISKSYTLDRLLDKFSRLGFHVEVPDYVLNYYNGDYKEQQEYKELAVAIKEMQLDLTNPKEVESPKIFRIKPL